MMKRQPLWESYNNWYSEGASPNTSYSSMHASLPLYYGMVRMVLSTDQPTNTNNTWQGMIIIIQLPARKLRLPPMKLAAVPIDVAVVLSCTGNQRTETRGGAAINIPLVPPKINPPNHTSLKINTIIYNHEAVHELVFYILFFNLERYTNKFILN